MAVSDVRPVCINRIHLLVAVTGSRTITITHHVDHTLLTVLTQTHFNCVFFCCKMNVTFIYPFF